MPDSPSQPVFFLATPMHDGRVHHAYLAGAIELSAAIPGRLLVGRYVGSFLPTSRDVLTAFFLRSTATHLLWVDSDIGWSAADVEKLFAARKDFVTGVYAKKTPERPPAPALLERREGELVQASHAPAGFLLLTRRCVETLVAAYPDLRYETEHGPAYALWAPTFTPGARYAGEDFAFSERWTKLGHEIWAHSGVVLRHYGERVFLPQGFAPERPRT